MKFKITISDFEFNDKYMNTSFTLSCLISSFHKTSIQVHEIKRDNVFISFILNDYLRLVKYCE